MGVCSGITRSGGHCTVSVNGAQEFCHLHDPARAAERRRAASRAAKSKPSREIAEIKGLLKDLTDRVLRLELGSGVGAVANQLINTRLRALELGRRLKETEELEARLEDLEAAQGIHEGGGRRYA
jgi:hypothetical protein